MMSSTTVSWAAAAKWAVRERGDAVSVVETHHGSIFAVIVDVQGSGDGAGTLAWSLAALATQLAGEGAAADGIATAVNRALWTRRRGRVQAAVGVLVIETTHTMTLARYGSVLIHGQGLSDELYGSAQPPPAGIDRSAAPWVGRCETAGPSVVMCSDGVADSPASLLALLGDDGLAHVSAEVLVGRAIARDTGRPKNDMSVVVVVPGNAQSSSSAVTVGRLTVRDGAIRSGGETRGG